MEAREAPATAVTVAISVVDISDVIEFCEAISFTKEIYKIFVLDILCLCRAYMELEFYPF